MRKISAQKITKAVSKLVMNTACFLRPDIENFFIQACETERKPEAKLILETLVKNAKLAKHKKIPCCQDTGMEIIFCELGQDAHVTNGDLEEAIQEGVALGSKAGYLRQSVVEDPLLRQNTLTNTPALIHYKIVPGNSLKIACLSKGFGSENKSAVVMLNPTCSIEELKNTVIEIIKKAGTSACPPYYIGIGLGGTMDKACELAKEALLIPVGARNAKQHLANLEQELLDMINQLEIGPLGFGGNLTAIDVKIKAYATHIAGLPLAVNVGCHAMRSGEVII